MPAPDVSIIITTRNRARHLEQTINAMPSVDVPLDLKVELVIVDNGSTDDTAAVVNSRKLPNMQLRYLSEPRPGKSIALNTALAATSGDLLMFSDDDVRPCRNWVTGLTAPLRSGTASAVQGGIVLADYLKRPWMDVYHRGGLADTVRLDPDNIDELVGANMAFLRDVLKDVPGFDPELGPGALGFVDDTLLGKQFLLAGHRIVSAFDVAVEHHFDPNRLTRADWLKHSMNVGRSQGYLTYHWEHFGGNPTLPLLKRPLRLRYLRAKHAREWKYPEGAPEWELNLLRDIYLWKQYAIERKRPRNYEKFGLVKLRA